MRIRAKRLKRFQARGVTGEQRFAGKSVGSPLDICFELTPANIRFAPEPDVH
jgi:hypothetical protein